MWTLPESDEAGKESDTETAFLLKICNVVERLIDEERRVLQLLNVNIPTAGLANYYVNVVVANAGLRTHTAVHRLFESRVSRQIVTEPDWNSVVGHMCGDPSFDLRMLAEVRKLTFRMRMEQATGIDDWRPTTKVRVDKDETAAMRMTSDEVDRVVQQYGCTVRENMERCDTLTLARFGTALGMDYARSAASHRAVVDALTDQLWTSATKTASRLLAERLSTISSLTVSEATNRVSHWLNNMLQSTTTKVEIGLNLSRGGRTF